MAEEKQYVCKQCGREFYHTPVGFSLNDFCSKGCQKAFEAERNRERLESEKKKGAKVLKKWEKELDKLRNDIARLNEALGGNEPKAIAKARKRRGGGCLGCIGKLLLLAFVIIVVFAALPNSTRKAFTEYQRDAQAASKTTVESQTNTVDELPPIELNANTNAPTPATEGPTVE